MSKSIKQLFEISCPNDLGVGLANKIIKRLERDQRRLARRNLFVFGLADVLSGTGLVLSLVYVAKFFITSGFYKYASLFWSDLELVNLYWQELTLSLVESLPVLGITASLLVTLALIFFLAKTISNFKLFYYQVNPA